MALIIPFDSSNPITKFSTSLVTSQGNEQFGFRARWNSRDAAWYMDVSDDTGTAFATGIKIVLGTYLGRQFNHRLFRDGVIVAVDLSGQGLDAGPNDLGTRVVVMQLTKAEVLSMRVTSDFPDATVVLGQAVS